ncbi:MAG: diphosphomevalonate/mevalonate 3,5-bisphosphate decarboxylase family protein, partial [Bacteroidota bacterium]
QGYEQTLLEESEKSRKNNYPATAGTVGWSCPSNIAIVKYWGKRIFQIPMNPSLSMTLKEATTRTRMEYDYDPGRRGQEIRFLFEGREAPAFEERITSFVSRIQPYIPWLSHTHLTIRSENTFPHSSGIASSASSMAALSMCMVQLEQEITRGTTPADPLKKSSFIARLGSGSASRSIFPYMALWGRTDLWSGSSDEFAIPLPGFHPAFRDMRDTILIVESGQKKVSSSTGHALMEKNPFSPVRFSQARENLKKLRTILEEGDWTGFISVLEEEALTLHAMMMTGRPGFLLMQPNTIAILHRIMEFREDTGYRAGFTLDAGANVHLLYSGQDTEAVDHFIDSELKGYCEKDALIRDRVGEGPQNI